VALRITGGAYKGKRLSVPDNPDLRPTPEKVREAFFNLIGLEIRDSRFLDAFAGTGAMGLEALSRGASFAVFIERDPATAASIRENIQDLGALSRSLVIKKDFFSASMAIKSMCDILFLDPPYHKNHYLDILDHLSEGMEIRDTCSIALEHFKKNLLPDRAGRLVKDRWRTYGDTVLSFYKKFP